MCRRYRHGHSLLELLTATTILVMVAGGIAALSTAVETAGKQGQGEALAAQHARVALERMEKSLRESTASSEFPGFAVFAETVGAYKFPDTLVVWRPASGAAANPTGRPLFGELTIYRPDPSQPNVLLEITLVGDGRTVPALSDSAAWTSELSGLSKNSYYKQVTLTDLLRIASPTSDALATTGRRGVLRFEIEQTPSDADLADFRSGLRAWKDLPWSQSIYGIKVGLRQSRCRVELQLMPGKQAAATDLAGGGAAVFFGSGAIYYQVNQ